MRITFKVSGGLGFFPGLAAPRQVDVDALEPAERDALRSLVQDAHFFDRPSSTANAVPDGQTYTITVEDEQRRHTVTVGETAKDGSLAALIARLRALTGAR